MTSNGGLVVSFHVVACDGLDAVDDSENSLPISLSRKVLAAPFGIMIDNDPLIPPDSVSSILAPTPGTQVMINRQTSSTHQSLWKQACLCVLESRGIPSSLLRSRNWASLAISKARLQGFKPESKPVNGTPQTITVPWPGALCFRKKVLDVSSTSRVGETIMSGHAETQDSLVLAKSWFNSAAERDDKLSRRRNERANQAAATAETLETQSSRPSALSPITLRQQTASGIAGVYPTPPDAIQHLSGITPSMDGTLSSPGNPLSVPATTEAEASTMQGVTVNRPEDDEGDFSDSRRLNGDGNLLDDADDMFEDMGGDMFGDNDVTEADFNFFDEQPTDNDLDTPMGNSAEVGEKLEEMNSGPTMEKDDDPTPKAEPDSPPVSKKNAVVFAKPELRHARSSQIDSHGPTTRLRTVKRSSSPFDPDTIFKRVRASTLVSKDSYSLSRLGKVFTKVDFDPKLPILNKKYEHGGLYDFGGLSASGTIKAEPGALPQTNYLKRHPKLSKRTKENTHASNAFVKDLGDSNTPMTDKAPAKFPNGRTSDYSASDSDSDLDDSSSDSGDLVSPSKSSFRATGLIDDDMVSQVTSLREIDHPIEEPDDQLARELPRLSLPEVPELSLARYFADPEPFSIDLSLSDEDFIQVAQLVTNQAVAGHLCIAEKFVNAQSCHGVPSRPLQLHASSRHLLHTLRAALSPLFGEVTPMSLKSILALQDIQLFNQPNRVQARAIAGRDVGGEGSRYGLYSIPSPHLEVRRSDSKISVLPSAMTFWESLGLAPVSGSKDVNAVCVFQEWDGMADNAKTFLSRMKSIYETAKLGTFDSLSLSPEQEDGLLPYEVDKLSLSPDATMTGNGSALVESMEALKGAISNLSASDVNIVVYFVYLPRNPGTIIEACAAFQRFIDSYENIQASKADSIPSSDIILQLVSAEIVSSPTEMVVTPGSQLVKLGMETYDRCTLFGGSMPAPAIRLEQPIPRIIDFKLTANPSASLIRENGCIHVAYAQSVDNRWVTAAWTDDRGVEQATTSYCAGRKGRPLSRSMNDIAHEIWESTLELISAWKVHWRIVITKCGPMEAQEADFWSDLARTEHKATVTMILLTVDTNPSLQVLPQVVEIPPQATTVYTTPASTPQPNIVSPEASATPATPAKDPTSSVMTPGGGADYNGDGDTDCVLVDITDQTWGAISGHRPNNATTVQDMQPAYLSGYLVKRTGFKAENAPVVLEINLVHTEAGIRAYEPLLREMLSYFRSLGTLARARGIVDKDNDIRPWHVAAAEKAVRALYLLM